PRSVHAVAVALARLDARQIAVPAQRRHLRQVDLRLGPGVVEQAELDARSGLRKQGEVGPFTVERGAEREWFTWPDLHRGSAFATLVPPPSRATREPLWRDRLQ